MHQGHVLRADYAGTTVRFVRFQIQSMFVWKSFEAICFISDSLQISADSRKCFYNLLTWKNTSETILSKVALLWAIILTVKRKFISFFPFPVALSRSKNTKRDDFGLNLLSRSSLSLYLYLDGGKKFRAEIHHTRNTFKRNYNFMKLIFHSRCTSEWMQRFCRVNSDAFKWNVSECWWRDVWSGSVKLQGALSELTPLHSFMRLLMYIALTLVKLCDVYHFKRFFIHEKAELYGRVAFQGLRNEKKS